MEPTAQQHATAYEAAESRAASFVSDVLEHAEEQFPIFREKPPGWDAFRATEVAHLRAQFMRFRLEHPWDGKCLACEDAEAHALRARTYAEAAGAALDEAARAFRESKDHEARSLREFSRVLDRRASEEARYAQTLSETGKHTCL